MNTFFKSVLSAAFLILITAGSLSAQKFGHINSQQLLMESPKIKAADASLETYQKQLITKGEGMVQKFEASYQAYVNDANAKTLSPIEAQKREAALTEMQQNIQKYEMEVQEKLAIKRQELYQPILNEATEAIEAIGKEGSYTMIFDTSTNSLLFAEDSDDLLVKVKTRLGW